MSKIHVYFMPGMAASSLIFERIELPNDVFEMHFLNWIMPEKGESLNNYALRMSEKIVHDNCVLVGVSFGGLLVQEMKEFVKPSKIIIISSVKSYDELPLRMKFAKKTKAYLLFPTGLLQRLELLSKLTFGSKFLKNRVELYQKYLSVNDKEYLDWSIYQILNWSRIKVDEEVIHIHGDKDEVFPPNSIKKYISVANGTHVMILTKYKWLNENLPKLMLEK
jgi:hypothetical protein